MSRLSKYFLNKNAAVISAIALSFGLASGCGVNNEPATQMKTVNGVPQGQFNPGTAPALPWNGTPDLNGANQNALKAITGSYTGTMYINGKIAHYQLGLTMVSNPYPQQTGQTQNQYRYYPQQSGPAVYLTLASQDAPVPFTVKSWVALGLAGNQYYNYWGTTYISLSSLSVLVPGLSNDEYYPLYVSVQMELALNSQYQIDPTQSLIDFNDCGSSGIVCTTSISNSFLANIVVNQDLRKVQ